MSEKRYSEREIREVFERAAREQEEASADAPKDGLTLAEMQEVAASAGIAPEFVERAAQSVALGEPEQGRQMIGPIARGVSRTQVLPVPPTAALWEDLVGDCQEMFEARGSVRQTGRVREWRNGNLRATLEPLGTGSRLRFQTRRDSVVPELAILAVVVVAALSLGADASSLAGIGIGLLIAALGTSVIWASQKRWANTRERQMDAIAERAVVRTTAAAPPLDSPARLDPPPRLDPAPLDELATEDPAAVEAAASTRRRARS